jgi:hypothetical protein
MLGWETAVEAGRGLFDEDESTELIFIPLRYFEFSSSGHSITAVR